MLIVSTVQEMTCIFNHMAKTNPKIKLTINKGKNVTSSPNASNKRPKAAVAKIKEGISRQTSLEGQGPIGRWIEGGGLKEERGGREQAGASQEGNQSWWCE